MHECVSEIYFFLYTESKSRYTFYDIDLTLFFPNNETFKTGNCFFNCQTFDDIFNCDDIVTMTSHSEIMRNVLISLSEITFFPSIRVLCISWTFM